MEFVGKEVRVRQFRVAGSISTLSGWFEVTADMVAESIHPRDRNTILDIGCGTANIAKFLPQDITYIGFDISSAYIDRARKRHPNRGPFFDRLFTAKELPSLPRFDIAIATNLLHHLDDNEALDLFQLVKTALKPDGRFITIDPCRITPQNRVARFIIDRDRGCNVREPAEYEHLAMSAFPNVRTEVKHRTWIPYTHCVLECCRKADEIADRL